MPARRPPAVGYVRLGGTALLEGRADGLSQAAAVKLLENGEKFTEKIDIAGFLLYLCHISASLNGNDPKP